MHLLTAQSGAVSDGSEPVDLDQPPGDIVVLSAADTEIAALARAQAAMPTGSPSLRLASLLVLGHNYSVDLYLEKTLAHARLVIVRLLGGASYWRYGLEEVTALARGSNIKLAVLPGDARPDPALAAHCTLEDSHCAALFAYLVEGGPDNLRRLLAYGAFLLNQGPKPAPAEKLPRAGLYKKNNVAAAPQRAAIVFYRALLQSADTEPVDALLEALARRNISARAYYVTSLKEKAAAQTITRAFAERPPDLVINLTGFALSGPGLPFTGTLLDGLSRPVIQAVLAGQSAASWQDNPQGLGPRDIAMHVALPEIDGRLFSRAISFKTRLGFDEATKTNIVGHKPAPDRVDFVARLAKGWLDLARTPPARRRIALILANYPTSDGRLANGVGLDTPAGTINVLKALADGGYGVGQPPESGAALMDLLTRGPTNTSPHRRAQIMLTLSDYDRLARTHLPAELREAVTARWGPPAEDPAFDPAAQAFPLALHRFGNLVLGIQPARGFDIDPRATHHDPELVPPHSYLAFYLWLRHRFAAQAVIHMGKHGNLEWLPGKALALSARCFPEALLGPLPHVYPFIVNDPGEGSQAKRRTGAVIIDHLTPPLTRAETYGPLKDLEALVDEYFEAAGVDPRRLALLGKQILDLARKTGLAQNCGIDAADDETAALQKLDNFLCELKEMQIRGGLHIFGESPQGEALTDLLLALVRLPRGDGASGNASLICALAQDLGLNAHGFDPLDCPMARPWQGPRPVLLEALTASPWRTHGDTVERLEILARRLITQTQPLPADFAATRLVLEALKQDIAPRVAACGQQEMAALLRALDGAFVPPGPSGAPTRGRLDVLPTGRNFYAIDNRIVPTQAAWELGKRSAELLITAYRQQHGRWPKAMGLSAWGTSNMRTGGDDVAQALALIGARPQWDQASRRVTGFKIVPLSELKRPRIDVLFRISGFFRDAFPGQIELLDGAITAIARLDEPEEANPIKARFATSPDAPASIFGTRPGGYGTGIQTLIETGAWDSHDELAAAWLDSSAHAYGGGRDGAPARAALMAIAKELDAVVHNQDAREFDLLDSDDFYQFEGGLAAAVKALSGQEPALFHNDHSRPDRPKIRKLEEELALVLHARALNPKWLAAMQRHGYKGASELAQTVTNLFGFAALTNAVPSQHFERIFEAYVLNEDIRAFLAEANPAALRDIARRLLEARHRHFWQPERNTAHDLLKKLARD